MLLCIVVIVIYSMVPKASIGQDSKDPIRQDTKDLRRRQIQAQVQIPGQEVVLVASVV